MRDFNEYLLEGIARKITPDKKRADSLKMSNKKILFLSALFLFLIFANILVKAQELGDTGLPPEVEKIQNISEKGKETVEKLTDKEKREYLFKEWQDLLLKNKAVSILDSFFTKISVVFYIFLGEPYTFSGIFFIMLILWFLFFFKFSEIFSDYSAFSGWVCWIIGLGMAVVVAQLKILRKIAEFFVWFAFYKEATWWRVLIVIAILVGLILAYKFTSAFGKAQKEKKQKTEEEINREKLKAGAKVAEAFTKALTK